MPGATQSFDVGGDSAYSVIAVCGLAFEAAIAMGPNVLTLCGLGSERMAARLENMIVQKEQRCLGIISFGTAGGLDPALTAGACVIANEIAMPDGCVPVDADWLRALRACLPEATQGTIAGTNQPLLRAADKACLWESSGACAVDMESHRAALVAQRHGIPFAACRVVVDAAHCNLPPAATAGLREDGTVAIMPVLRALAASPRQLPELIQLASDADAAKRTLRSVRARLGIAFAIPLYQGCVRPC
jgi:hopanoid-associated phosphorylase